MLEACINSVFFVFFLPPQTAVYIDCVWIQLIVSQRWELVSDCCRRRLVVHVPATKNAGGQHLPSSPVKTVKGSGTDLNTRGSWQFLLSAGTDLFDLFLGYYQRKFYSKEITPCCRRLILSLGSALEVTAAFFLLFRSFTAPLTTKSTLQNEIFFKNALAKNAFWIFCL